jgi:hypothetical protein
MRHEGELPSGSVFCSLAVCCFESQNKKATSAQGNLICLARKAKARVAAFPSVGAAAAAQRPMSRSSVIDVFAGCPGRADSSERRRRRSNKKWQLGVLDEDSQIGFFETICNKGNYGPLR